MDNRNIPYVVEPMTLADVPAVAVLEKAVFSLPWSRYAFEHEVQHNPMAHFLVLRLREGRHRSDPHAIHSLATAVFGWPLTRHTFAPWLYIPTGEDGGWASSFLYTCWTVLRK